MKVKILLFFFSALLSLTWGADQEGLPKDVRLVIEGSDESESTFIVMHYQEGVGVNYYEYEKPAGRVSALVEKGILELDTLRGKALKKEPLSLEEVKEIRLKTNKGTLFVDPAYTEKKLGCALFKGGVTSVLSGLGALAGLSIYERVKGKRGCIFLITGMGPGNSSGTLIRPITFTGKPSLTQAAKDNFTLLLEPSLKKWSIGIPTVTLMAYGLCAHGSAQVEPRRQDTRWIFAHDPMFGAKGEAAKPIDSYSAKKITIQQIKDALNGGTRN